MNIKKVAKPTIVVIGSAVFLIGLVVLIILGLKTHSEGFRSVSDCWNMWYYAFSIIGSVATTVTVIVALFKDEILRRFHSPELSIENYSNGVIPIVKVDGNSGDGGDSYYKCELKINNQGSENARDCTLVISRFLYDTSRMEDGSMVEWNSSLIERVKEIGEKNSQIVSGLDARIELFRVENPSSSSTPNGGNDNKSYIVFPQTKLSDEISSESNFEIDYEIRSENANPIKFKVFIEWTGRWNDSVSEMSNNIKVKIQVL